jgi:hypothetical protein
MHAAAVLKDLQAAGLRVEAEGNTLKVRPASVLDDERRALIRQHKAELLALLKTTTRSCSDCRHLTGYGTCREPVAAGLIPAADGFAIAWPPPGAGASCPVWSRSPAEAVAAVWLAAGRGGWTDAQLHEWLAAANEHPDATLDVLRRGGPTP